MESTVAKSVSRFLMTLKTLGLISYDTWWFFNETSLIYKWVKYDPP